MNGPSATRPEVTRSSAAGYSSGLQPQVPWMVASKAIALLRRSATFSIVNPITIRVAAWVSSPQAASWPPGCPEHSKIFQPVSPHPRSFAKARTCWRSALKSVVAELMVRPAPWPAIVASRRPSTSIATTCAPTAAAICAA